MYLGSKLYSVSNMNMIYIDVHVFIVFLTYVVS